jgi:Na+/H+ antiporter NhaD/arsenite permease-like protein
LCHNELQHVPDGEYLSGIFYLSMFLGVTALFSTGITEIFWDYLSVGEESFYL